MARSRLKLVGRYVAWGPHIREARLTRSDGSTTRALVRVLPDLDAKPATLARLREDATLLASIRHENVLRVEHVTAVRGHAALVLEPFDGISLQRALELLRYRGQPLPTRAAVEIVAMVATALDAVMATGPFGPDKAAPDSRRSIVHPGPSPEEVLIDSLGRVKLTGFIVYKPGDKRPASAMGYAPPEGSMSPWSATYGVGALLGELLTGELPPPADQNPIQHEAVIRRFLIRIMAKPGEAASERVVQLIRQSMLHEQTERPLPSLMARRLRELALALHSPGLSTWGPASVPAIMRWQKTPTKPAIPATASQDSSP